MLSVGNVMGLAWVLIEVDSYCKLCILWVLFMVVFAQVSYRRHVTIVTMKKPIYAY